MLEQANEAAHGAAVRRGSARWHQEQGAIRRGPQSRPAPAGGGAEHARQDAGQGVVADLLGQGAWPQLSVIRQGLSTAEAQASESHRCADAEPGCVLHCIA